MLLYSIVLACYTPGQKWPLSIIGSASEFLKWIGMRGNCGNTASGSSWQTSRSRVYGKSGVPAALLRFAQLKERTYRGDDDEVYAIATQYGIARDKDKVLEWLNRASGRGAMWFMLRNPAF